MNSVSHNRYWILALAGPATILLVHAFYYYPYFVDDAFISMRYAQRLISGHGLTWNDGEAVEGYSDLLWVLLMAAMNAVGFDMLASARVVSLISTIATMMACSYYAIHVAKLSWTSLLFGNLALVFAAPVAIWSLAGLECTLVMALLGWTYVFAIKLLETASIKHAVYCGILLALLCLCRPEGPVFTIIIAAAIWLFTSVSKRQMLWPLCLFCAIPAAIYLVQIGFRLSYYGNWFANTVHAKVAWTYSRLLNGFMYIIKALAVFAPLCLLLALKMDQIRKQEPVFKRTMMLLVICLSWLIVVMLGGGDFFPGFRHILAIVPAIIFLSMDAAECIYRSSDRLLGKQLFLGYILACLLWLQFTFTEHQEAKDTQYWNQYGITLGKAIKARYKETQPTIAVALAGVIPFYSELPGLDIFGLTDPDMTARPGDAFGHGFIGHDLLNVPYVLSKKPDIIVFFLGRTKPLHAFTENTDFKQNYHAETLELPEYTATLWVRNDSKKVK